VKAQLWICRPGKQAYKREDDGNGQLREKDIKNPVAFSSEHKNSAFLLHMRVSRARTLAYEGKNERLVFRGGGLEPPLFSRS
jgi:hypothetical protein